MMQIIRCVSQLVRVELAANDACVPVVAWGRAIRKDQAIDLERVKDGLLVGTLVGERSRSADRVLVKRCLQPKVRSVGHPVKDEGATRGQRRKSSRVKRNRKM